MIDRLALFDVEHRVAGVNQLIDLRVVVAGLFSFAAVEIPYPVVRVVEGAGAERGQIVISGFALRHQGVEIHHLRFKQHADLPPVLLGDGDQRIVEHLLAHQQGQLQALALFDADTVGASFPAGLIQQLFRLRRIVMVRIDAFCVKGPGDRGDRLDGDFAVPLVDHVDQLLPVQAINQRLAYPLILQRRTMNVEFHLAVVAGAVKINVGEAEHLQLFDIVRTRGKGVVVGLPGLEQLEVGRRIGHAIDKARRWRRPTVKMAIGMEANFLTGNIGIVHVRAVAQRLAVQ